MDEKEQLLKALKYYRNFVDSVVVPYPTVQATAEAEERYIFENLPSEIADQVQTAWVSMSDTQKLAVASLTQHSRADAYFSGVGRVMEKLNHVQISIEGITLPEAPTMRIFIWIGTGEVAAMDGLKKTCVLNIKPYWIKSNN